MRIPQTPPPFQNIFAEKNGGERFTKIWMALKAIPSSKKYLHWDELRFRTPPAGLTHEEWWSGLKFERMGASRGLPLKDKGGKSFAFTLPDLVTELLHQIDRDGGTLIQIPEPVTNPAERDRYLMRSLMEEAITSSQLEGAGTTRAVAKKMLADGRAPRDRSEQMILNNFRTMQRIIDVKEETLSPDLVLDIHRRVSEHALDTPDAAGRLRRADEPVDVSDNYGCVFHVPPAAAELQERLAAMCDFANGRTPDYFIHPVVRAVILHFWLAYDHPFVDGNGRTARALFYWQMLHAGYWLFEFVSISQIIKKSPVAYGTAYLHTETDDNDLTYFLIHQADVVRKALLELHAYVARKSKEMTVLHAVPDLNHRQIALLTHALRHPNARYDIAGHEMRHGVVYQTARVDLLSLAAKGLLEQRKSGRSLVFISPVDLEERLRKTGH